MRANNSFATAQGSSLALGAQQLSFYVLVGLAVPGVIWSTLRGVPLSDEGIRATIISLLLANIGAWYIIGALRRYARARLLSYVLPVNLALFGLALAVASLARINFAYSLFIPCFIASVGISYLVTAKSRHTRPDLMHYLVPAGSADQLRGKYGFEELRSSEDFKSLIDNGMITGSVIADLHHDHSNEWEQLFAKAALAGIPVYHYRLIEESLSGEVRIEHLRENDLGSLIPNLPYMSAKRAVDLLASVLLAPAFLILGGLIALAIKLDSDGSVLFFQDRVGFRGKAFKMVKFRTMHEVAKSQEDGAQRDLAMTKDDDQRVTKVGRFLRRTRLDEIPQIWNIFAGDMSWIGPRPEAKELGKWYEAEIPFYSYRHIVRPGITGWAQVNQGHVTSVEAVESKLRLDFYYVKNLSLWLDTLIALKTIRVIIQGIGAK